MYYYYSNLRSYPDMIPDTETSSGGVAIFAASKFQSLELHIKSQLRDLESLRQDTLT
jgi:hypothetical protein